MLVNLIFIGFFLVQCPIHTGCTQSRDLLIDWHNQISNFSHVCDSSAPDLQGVEVLKTVDCTLPSSRSNFKLKYNSKIIRQPHPLLDGFEIIHFDVLTQSAASKNQLFCNLCFETFSPHVKSVEATFKHGKLEGKVKIAFEDGTLLLGFGVNNKLVGILRYFQPNGTFINATVLSPDFASLHTTHGGFFSIPTAHDEVLFTKNFGDILSCHKITPGSPYYKDCQQVTFDQIQKSKDGCLLEGLKNGARSGEKFHIQIESNQMWHRNVPRHLTKEIDQEPREIIDNWITYFKNNQDHFWFGDFSHQPLDEKNPSIKIYLPDLVGRSGFETGVVTISSYYGVETYTGFITNGVLEARIDPQSSTNREWMLPLTIKVVRIDKQGAVNPDLTIYGKIHLGHLDGLVYINRTLSADRHRCSAKSFHGIGFIGTYRNGIPFGNCWKQLAGGSWLYGKVDHEGHFSGDNIAFIHQDIRTAYLGTFQKGLMISGQEAEVKSLTFDTNGMLVAEFTKPHGPFFHYDPPNSTFLGDQPLIRDPVDLKYIIVKEAKKYLGSGESIFAKIDIPENTIFSLMSGLIYNSEESDAFRRLHFDIEKNYRIVHPKRQELNAYRIPVPSCGFKLILTPEYSSLKRFNNTVGHKVNHSFDNNASFLEVESARFGLIPSVNSLKSIKAGEEIFASYLYEYHLSPLWYRKLMVEYLENHPDELSFFRSNKTVDEMKADIIDQEEYLRRSNIEIQFYH